MPKYDFVPLSDMSPEIEKQAKMIQFIKDQYLSERINMYQAKHELRGIGILKWVINLIVPDWKKARKG